MIASRVVLLALVLVFWVEEARADGFESVPVGARTGALGGAGIARGWDSAMPTLNPAGIALVPGSVASLSAAVYGLQAISIPKFVSDEETFEHSMLGQLRPSKRSFSSSELSAFPSSLSYFLHLGGENPMVVALALSVPRSIRRSFADQVDFEGEMDPRIHEDISAGVENFVHLGSASWAMSFGRLRVGASLLLARTREIVSVQLTDLLAYGQGEEFIRFDGLILREGVS
jgi:hypothetical protein